MNEPDKPPIGSTTETRIVDVIKTENEATRRHISSVVGGIRSDTEITKTRMDHVKTMVRRLLRVFGIGTDDVL